MKSNGGVLSADEVVHQPITTVLSGPAAGALGAGPHRRQGRLRQGAHLRRRRHLDRRQRRPRRRADADHRGHRRRLPQQDPDDRRRHGRRRRRVDRLDLPRGHAQGRPAVGRRRPGPALLRQGRHRADDHRRPRHARPDPAAPARRRDPARRRRGPRRHRRTRRHSSACDADECATGILEISAWNQANALRQVSVKRGLDVRDFMLADVRRLGLAARAAASSTSSTSPASSCPQNPGNVSAFGLLTVDVKNDYVQTAVARTPRSTTPPVQTRRSTTSPRRPPSALDGEGFAAGRPPLRRAPPTCATSARPSRCASPPPRARSTRRMPTRVADRVPRRAPRALRLRLPRRPDASRSSGSTCGSPASARSPGPSCARSPPPQGSPTARERARTGARPVCFDADAGYVDTDVYWRPDLRAGDDVRRARRSSRSSARRSRSTPASPSASTRIGNLVITKERVNAQAAHGIRARPPADDPGSTSTRSSSRSSRAPSPASRWRSRPPSRAPPARP